MTFRPNVIPIVTQYRYLPNNVDTTHNPGQRTYIGVWGIHNEILNNISIFQISFNFYFVFIFMYLFLWTKPHKYWRWYCIPRGLKLLLWHSLCSMKYKFNKKIYQNTCRDKGLFVLQLSNSFSWTHPRSTRRKKNLLKTLSGNRYFITLLFDGFYSWVCNNTLQYVMVLVENPIPIVFPIPEWNISNNFPQQAFLVRVHYTCSSSG